MKFESLKCDECGRIQDISNHWLKMAVWIMTDNSAGRLGLCVGIALGEMAPNGLVADSALYLSLVTVEAHDLCGQGCAMKHIAKLLGWSAPTEGA